MGKDDFHTLANGIVHVFSGTVNATFSDAKVSFKGTMTSSRWNQSVGNEFVTEKNYSRRSGCSATGCY